VPTIQISLKNIHSTILNPTPTLLSVVDKALSVKADNTWHSKAYKEGRWDGMYRLFSKHKRSFPTGLFPLVRKTLEAQNFIVEVIDERTGVVAPDISGLNMSLVGITPRNDQVIAVKNCVRAKRGLIASATGTGKTVIISLLVQNLPGNCLIFVNTKTLLSQTQRTIEALTGENVGLVGGGQAVFNRITVCTIQSASKLDPDWLTNLNSVIVDECHHVSAKSFYNTLNLIPALYRFGFSADPTDSSRLKVNSDFNALKIEGVFGPCIHTFTTEYATKNDILAKAEVRILPLKVSNLESATYAVAYGETVLNSKLNEMVIEVCQQHKGEQCLILVKTIAHGKALKKSIAAATGQRVEFLAGADSNDLRESVIADFKAGTLTCLIGSNIFKEGVDLPSVDVMINAAGDVAPTKQRIGRAVRKKYGKANTVVVYDFYIKGNPYLQGHSDKRLLIYKKDGHKVLKQ